jgi:hypothetical protein
MKTDRLRILSIGILAVVIMCVVFGWIAHDTHLALFTVTLVVLGTVLESIRLEFRDLRREIEALAAKLNVLPKELMSR